MLRKSLVCALLLVGWGSQANADLFITLTDNGSGGTAGTITGTFDVSSGANFGGSGIVDHFGANTVLQQIVWERDSTGASTRLGVQLLPDPSNPTVIVATP